MEMTNESVRDTAKGISEIGKDAFVRLGSGACGILNGFRAASDKFEDYYVEKEGKKNVLDYVVKTANSIGRGAAWLTVTGAKTFKKSLDVFGIPSGISKAYNGLREKYTSYLDKSTEQIRAQMEATEKAGFGLKFKAFMNTIANGVERAYTKGVGFVKDVSAGVKGSDAYKDLSKAASGEFTEERIEKSEARRIERNIELRESMELRLGRPLTEKEFSDGKFTRTKAGKAAYEELVAVNEEYAKEFERYNAEQAAKQDAAQGEPEK